MGLTAIFELLKNEYGIESKKQLEEAIRKSSINIGVFTQKNPEIKLKKNA